MAKKNEEVAQAATNDQLMIGEEVLSIEQICANVDGMKQGALLSSDMWTLQIGEEVKVVFVEMTKIEGLGTKAGTLVDAAKILHVGEGKLVTIGDVVAVSFFRTATPKKAYLLECVGMKGGAGRQYKDINIYNLV